MIPAAKFGQAADESEALELSEEEKEIEQNLKVSTMTSVGFNGIGLIEADCLPIPKHHHYALSCNVPRVLCLDDTLNS